MATPDVPRHSLSRRQALGRFANGFGGLALAALLGEQCRADAAQRRPDNPLAPRPPHFAPRARRVIFLYMLGGPSQVDTFDDKPLLRRDHGKPLPFAGPKVIRRPTGTLLASPWAFKQYGDNGMTISELFPHVAGRAGDLCVVNSLHGTNPEHASATLMLHTGSDSFVRPSLGSWVLYGLGSENGDLPGFVSVCPSQFWGGARNRAAAFLPAVYQGTAIGREGVPTDKATVDFLDGGGVPRDLQAKQLSFLESLNRRHLERAGPDSVLDARIESFELAFRMQASVPSLTDVSGESAATLSLYGVDEPVTRDFGLQCLLARRMAERGVRFIQLNHRPGESNWDQHADLRTKHAANAAEVDKPIAGLLSDLKGRGLLEDTLVIWGSEFGRTPVCEGAGGDNAGREHNPHGFSMWLAGGGVRGGIKYGETDDYGYYAAKDKVHIHDLHATVLHLLGLDHERLTYRHAGRDFRLTDVYGNVVKRILA